MAEANLDIAKAVLTANIPIRTIAYVTLVLLLPSLIATIFGMKFFVLDDQTGSLIVAKTFWQYWAVTIPVTAFTIII
jgi:Mg2+ and Co2+ transporter CorA